MEGPCEIGPPALIRVNKLANRDLNLQASAKLEDVQIFSRS